MAEQTTNYIEIDGEGKYIEDTEAREGVAQNAADITAINTLLAKMQTIYTITPQNTAAILMGGFGCQRVGNVVMLQVTPYIRVINQQTLLATGFPKPSSEIRFQCVFQNSEGKHILLYLNSDGELSTVGNFPSGTPFDDWLVGFLVYITKDPLPN